MPLTARAQLDSSSAFLLNDGRSYRDSTLDSDRYTVRPKDPTKRDEPRPSMTRKVQPRDTEEGDPSPVTVTVPDAADPAESPPSAPIAPQTTSSDLSPTGPKDMTPSGSAAAPSNSRSRDGVPLRSGNELNGASQQGPSAIPPRDLSRRFNLVELTLAPGYLYLNSDSQSFYRRYTMAAPVLSVDANIWLNPNFALAAGYLSTMSGSINDSLSGARSVPATNELFKAGFRVRQFFGNEPLANSMTFGIDYSDDNFRVPSDAQVREKIRSTGVRLSLEAEIQVDGFRSWTVGASFSPKQNHTENATSLSAQTGGNVDANQVGISVGGRMQFERMNAIFWRLSQTVQKNMYSGDTSVPDPQTNQTLTGVSVTNSSTILLIGYTWGN